MKLGHIENKIIIVFCIYYYTFSHLPLNAPEVKGLATGLVPQTLIQLESCLVEQLENGQLGGQLQAVWLHPTPHCDFTWWQKLGEIKHTYSFKISD